jgi:hypothetical protein
VLVTGGRVGDGSQSIGVREALAYFRGMPLAAVAARFATCMSACLCAVRHGGGDVRVCK